MAGRRFVVDDRAKQLLQSDSFVNPGPKRPTQAVMHLSKCRSVFKRLQVFRVFYHVPEIHGGLAGVGNGSQNVHKEGRHRLSHVKKRFDREKPRRKRQPGFAQATGTSRSLPQYIARNIEFWAARVRQYSRYM